MKQSISTSVSTSPSESTKLSVSTSPSGSPTLSTSSSPTGSPKHSIPNIASLSPIWIKRDFETIYLDHGSDNEPLGEFLEKHLFFITARFDLKKRLPPKTDLQNAIAENKGTRWGQLLGSGLAERKRTQLSEFEKLHFEISRKLIGHNLNRKRNQQPRTWVFTDFEGSRTGRSDALHSEMPHIHALMLVRPEHLENFQSLISEPWLVWIPSIKNIQIENFCSKKGSVENLIAYCMKGYAQALKAHGTFEDHGREDLWAILPA